MVLLFASQSGKAENFATKAFFKFKSLFQAKVKDTFIGGYNLVTHVDYICSGTNDIFALPAVLHG